MKTTKATAEITEYTSHRLSFWIVGRSPLIHNRMSEKAKRELLMPKGRKTSAERAQAFKHNPVEEFRNSMEKTRDAEAPTLIVLPAPAFKGGMMTAALDMPGTRKTEIGRLCWVNGYHVPVWGVPMLHMSVVRSADMNKTPDIRTRAIMDRWATRLDIEYMAPKLDQKMMVQLLSLAGVTSGVGDFRQEKGKGNFGQFRIVDEDDAELRDIMATGGREAQAAALEAAEPYDDDAVELLAFWNEEAGKRGNVRELKAA